MSFKEEKREAIKTYILEKIADGERDIAKKTAQAFSISLNTVYRYIRDLEQKNIIKRSGRTFSFVGQYEGWLLNRKNKELESEDEIYHKYIASYVNRLPENVKNIWQYAFMEMMNNAIDHSGAAQIQLSIFQSYMSTTILISDNGIGIFQKIREYYHYASLDDAVNELFKGKLTTDSANHSGEGIFFTSRALDKFAAFSDGKIFSHDKYDELLSDIANVPMLKAWQKRKGTVIYMELSNFSKRLLKEVFDMFSDVDGGFTRTSIPVKNFFDIFPVSRSQAKRLCSRLENFQEVDLDFSEISEIGQGFAHEIFVVFQKKHPDIRLHPINTTKEVQKMIYHVLHS